MAGTLVEKRCKRCGEVKSAREFSRHRKERDGLQGNCKACNAADWEANREAIAARRRVAYKVAHPAAHRAYRETNPEAIAARRAARRDKDAVWRATNREAPVEEPEG